MVSEHKSAFLYLVGQVLCLQNNIFSGRLPPSLQDASVLKEFKYIKMPSPALFLQRRLICSQTSTYWGLVWWVIFNTNSADVILAYFMHILSGMALPIRHLYCSAHWLSKWICSIPLLIFSICTCCASTAPCRFRNQAQAYHRGYLSAGEVFPSFLVVYYGMVHFLSVSS